MPKWERCNEKFDWFLEMLFEGKTVAINPYDYGDFLKYVQWSGLEKEFDQMERVDKEIDDDAFPMVHEITLMDRKKVESKVVIDFKKILSELESKKIKLCFLKGRGLFVEDDQKNLYQMEVYRQGSYLDRLIKDGMVVEFHQVDNHNVEDWEKEIWGVSEVEGFIKRQSL